MAGIKRNQAAARSRSTSATAWGLVGLALWSTTVAVNPSLIARIGPFLTAAIGCSFSGIVLFIIEAVHARSLTQPFRVPAASLLTSGPCFLVYFSFMNFAFYISPSHETDILLGLVNYLWPPLMLLFSIPLLGNLARWPQLAAGILLGVVGVVFSAVQGTTGGTALLGGLEQAPLAFTMMLIAAICWALYSNLVTRNQRYGLFDGLPLFQLLTGGVMLLMQLGFGPKPTWDCKALGYAAYIAIGPTLLGYLFWQRGMSVGRQAFLGAASYMLPAVSTLIASWHFGVDLTWPVVAGCALLIAGAFLSRRGVVEVEKRRGAPEDAPPKITCR